MRLQSLWKITFLTRPEVEWWLSDKRYGRPTPPTAEILVFQAQVAFVYVYFRVQWTLLKHTCFLVLTRIK